MKILILSDTHGLLRPEVRKMLGDCDAVIHCGDYHTQKIVDEIRDSVSVDTQIFLVRGNNDGRWAASLPEHLEFVLGNVKFCAVHDKADLPEEPGDCRVLLYGHSHRYTEEWRDGRLWLNPGSCGRRRFRLGITMAVLYLEDGKISVERMDISDEKGSDIIRKDVKGNAPMDLPADLCKLVRNIMKRMDKGYKVDRISRELGVRQDFVEDICRIRVTHPGISAEGIVNKIEVNRSSDKRSSHCAYTLHSYSRRE